MEYSRLSDDTYTDISCHRSFLLLLLYLELYNLSEEYSIYISPLSAGSGSSGSSAVFAGGLIAEEVGVGHKGPGDTTTVDVLTFLEFFLSMSLRSPHFDDEAYFW